MKRCLSVEKKNFYIAKKLLTQHINTTTALGLDPAALALSKSDSDWAITLLVSKSWLRLGNNAPRQQKN